MAQTTEDLQEELNSALRRAESAEYWIERNADLLRECGESAAALPPEREVLLVSISEMNRRIAEAEAVERERCVAIYEGIFNLPKEIALRTVAREKIRGAKC